MISRKQFHWNVFFAKQDGEVFKTRVSTYWSPDHELGGEVEVFKAGVAEVFRHEELRNTLTPIRAERITDEG